MNQIITKKRANQDDAKLLFDWRNDDVVRKNSFNSEIIPYPAHLEWLSKCLSNPNVEIYIYSLNDIPFGQVRLNYSDTTVFLSYSVAETFRGQGFGKFLINDIETIIRTERPTISHILAEVKLDNIASQKIFEENGFVITENADHYSYDKDLRVTQHTPIDISSIIYFNDRERERERESYSSQITGTH